jgi:hypothetical protein
MRKVQNPMTPPTSPPASRPPTRAPDRAPGLGYSLEPTLTLVGELVGPPPEPRDPGGRPTAGAAVAAGSPYPDGWDPDTVEDMWDWTLEEETPLPAPLPPLESGPLPLAAPRAPRPGDRSR